MVVKKMVIEFVLDGNDTSWKINRQGISPVEAIGIIDMVNLSMKNKMLKNIKDESKPEGDQ